MFCSLDYCSIFCSFDYKDLFRLQVMAIGFYILENWKMYYGNPAFFIFWVLEVFAYSILTYTASINLGYDVRE